MNRENNFNLLRLFAAAQVVYAHSMAHLHLPSWDWLSVGLYQFPGVAVFFIISGFLISESCLRSTTGGFFFNRAIRIYPALIVNIIILEALIFVTGGMTADIWTYAEFLPIYLATASDYFGALAVGGPVYAPFQFFTMYPSGVLWTLTVELSFYVVLPPILWAVGKLGRGRGTILLLALMLASFAIVKNANNDFYNTHQVTNVLIAPYFWVFGIGVVARLWWDRIAPLFVGRALWWIAAYVAVTLTAVYSGDDAWVNYKLEPGFIGGFRTAIMGCLVLSAAYTLPDLTKRLRLDKNDFSYGLYLWHMLIVSTLISLHLTDNVWLWPVVFGGGFTLAAASWFLIERRALELKKSRRSIPPAAPQYPAGATPDVALVPGRLIGEIEQSRGPGLVKLEDSTSG